MARTPDGTIVYITNGIRKRQQNAPCDTMNQSELQNLLAQVACGDLKVDAAAHQLMNALRASPYEDLGFARVDHHRALRQGFPEVVLGLGKTPAQIAALDAEIVARGSTQM